MGRLSRVRQPFVRDTSIAIWKLFSDLDLSEARKTHFDSLHDCFTRELKEGARPVDPDPGVLVSPCDGIIGAAGQVVAGTVLQAKGFPYTVADLLGDPELAARYRNGSYVTLRLTSSMYHRFHAPHELRVERVTYISGDTWNVKPDRAQADRAAVLQERTGRHSVPAGSIGPPDHAGAGRGHPGCQHPTAIS